MTTKSLILYGSEYKLTNAHKLVTGRLQPEYYVRSEIVEGDCGSAMSKVHLLPHETLLNTVDVVGPMPKNPRRKSE